MVVIVIIGLLVGLVAPAVLHQLGNARVSVTKLSIERLGSVLEMYKLDVGDYPSTQQGLNALVVDPGNVTNWNGPYVKTGESLNDQWGHPYIYRNPSNRANIDYDLCSLGPNNQGAEASKLICNK
jgi:general secretion pathway protein G